MHWKRLGWTMCCVVAVWLSIVSANGIAAPALPAPSPQRTAAERWVGYLNVRNLRAACEMQTIGEARGQSAVGEPCGALPTQVVGLCPQIPPGAKPPYRKSELRTLGEQVGEYTEETPTRGFVRLDAEVKASKAWGVLGLEQVAGVWRTVYLRYGGETAAPAGNVYQSTLAYHKLWVTNWCPVLHPKWEKQR